MQQLKNYVSKHIKFSFELLGRISKICKVQEKTFSAYVREACLRAVERDERNARNKGQ